MIWAVLTSVLASPPVVLAELYTSQGCSSCPPADQFLGELDGEGQIYVLSYHVDYWNRLGWTDPYSSPEWTQRQRAVGRTLKTEGRIYTPMMVVNGGVHVVGSNRAKAKAEIARAIQKDASTELKVSASRQGSSVRAAATALDGRSWVIRIALVEKSRSNKISTGENSGSTGVHHRVVRAMETTNGSTLEASLSAPKDFNWSGASIMAWVEDPLTGIVSGASRFNLE